VVDHKVAAEVEFVALRDDLVALRHALAAEQVGSLNPSACWGSLLCGN
jgi:hypothetical protein